VITQPTVPAKEADVAAECPQCGWPSPITEYGLCNACTVRGFDY
jgi:NMD protein affecting ribosome stability and mRNA decay